MLFLSKILALCVSQFLNIKISVFSFCELHDINKSRKF